VKAVLLALLVVATACSSKQSRYLAQGVVRNVWCHDDSIPNCDVVFEHDSGSLQRYVFYGRTVPLWTGMHATISYRCPDGGEACTLDWAARIQ